VSIRSRRQGETRYVDAVWHGGAYIDVHLGGLSTASEVLNVYDYAAGRVSIPEGDETFSEAVRREVRAWIAENDREWPTWYADYIANTN
jgi:hypothetical protein